MQYNVISADSHVDLGFLPWDLFTSQAPTQYADRVPRVENHDGTDQWWADGVYLEDVGHYSKVATYNPGMKTRVDRMAATGFIQDAAEGRYHPTDPDLRIKDQDADGVDAEVIYGMFAVATKLKDQELVASIYRTYNDWIADFSGKRPDRLRGLACLPNHDPQAAADEVRRIAAKGLVGVEFGVATAVKPMYYRDWDVLWEAVAECGVSISFHTTGLYPRPPEPGDEAEYALTHRVVNMVTFQLSGAEILASMVLSGACERHPDLKFVLGECGVTWIPYVLDRMDHEDEGDATLSMIPSDYWKRQGYSTFQKEAFAGDMIDFIGEDNVMWGSDYPHPDGVWPDSQETIESNLKGLKDETKRMKIIRDTAAKLYRFTNGS